MLNFIIAKKLQNLAHEFIFPILFSSIILFLGAGCGPRYVDFFPRHDDGTRKPHVAMIPIINSLDEKLPDDFAEMFTQSARYEMMNNSILYLFSEDEISTDLARCPNKGFFTQDLSFAKAFTEAEFVVAAELIEHQVIPYEKDKAAILGLKNASSGNLILIMKLRLRIIDVRKEKPRIILQEIMASNHRVFGIINEDACKISSDHFAYETLIQDFVSRVENIICNER